MANVITQAMIDECPFDLTPVCTSGENLHERASRLAHDAIRQIVTDTASGGLEAFLAERKAEADAIRAVWQAKHLERIAQAKAEAAARREARIAAHNARNAAMKAMAAEQRALKIAA